ncbi:chaperone modulator CbpM [Bradyrhizobium sp.]|jgi:chaperone modulatory protein CbpM|uniref:chaperone modulator CbpM n=1 Tax=Bradyrhizobium sp. TaxID=376 RepID=UPI003C3A6037
MKISKEEFLSLAGMDHETLDVWIEEEWLRPRGSSVELSFSNIDIARARLIHQLKVDLGVNDEGVGVILNLVDQLYGLRRTLMELRQTIRTAPEPD